MFSNYLVFVLKTILRASISLVASENKNLILILRDTKITQLHKIFSVLRYSSLTRLNTLTEFTASDFPQVKSRFTLNLFLLSLEYNYRLVVNINIAQDSTVPSLISSYANSNWSERELRDMFGIYFSNNVDLRRLLTDYGFEGFPLRKDFPLTGYLEVRYDDEKQQILYEPVLLAQEFRLFSLSSPWESK